MRKQSKANVTPKRQRTQYSCMATSMSMCLQALGYYHANEDEVNKVMGALPMRGASWEQALACVQHYGCRATLTMPSTVKQLKEWTDKGIPVMIAWNPEGRDWSHASVVFHVDEDLNVYVADPNIPDPDETVRVVPKTEFYSKWYEKWPNYLVRRPACAIEREITPEGKQIMASNQKENKMSKHQEIRKLAREIKSIKAELSLKSSSDLNSLHNSLNGFFQGILEKVKGAEKAVAEGDFESAYDLLEDVEYLAENLSNTNIIRRLQKYMRKIEGK